MEVICDYCNKPAQLVGGNKVYPHRQDLHYLKFWVCNPCEARVGCHKNSKNHAPLGRLANAELRAAKSEAHQSFDPIWKEKHMKRNAAYIWLADTMKMDVRDCHIGMMNIGQCRLVVAHAEAYLYGIS